MFFVVVTLIQLAVTLVIGAYFSRQLKAQGAAPTNGTHSRREYEKLQKMRTIRLSEPLSELTRPASFGDIVGQDEGIKALKAILCSKNPQHMIIYGPPGVGKTCAARLALEAAKAAEGTPFDSRAPFIEMDATCVRFDERAIADPLIGSVHDPIYQGAGQLGVSGVPQPKAGAVSRAHGGVLFLDEIGELHPMQLNKLLKVLEDRLVRFESAYYNPDDGHTPRHIHDIFQNGLPADFRLIGATTRSPEEMPPALRSRCMEVFFRALEPEELQRIAAGAAAKLGAPLAEDEAALIGKYSESGRDAVNIVQLAANVARQGGREALSRKDVEWVLDAGRYSPRPEAERPTGGAPRPGLVNGLAVCGGQNGAVMRIEAIVVPGTGKMRVTGIVEQEQLGDGRGHTSRRTSMALAAAENALARLRAMGIALGERDLRVNFPGGAPVDGPSAGVAMAVAMYSALTGAPAARDVAMTGEIALDGGVLPVGGVSAKLAAARKAGMRRALIPRANYQSRYADFGDTEVVPVDTLDEALALALDVSEAGESGRLEGPLSPVAAARAEAERSPA